MRDPEIITVGILHDLSDFSTHLYTSIITYNLFEWIYSHLSLFSGVCSSESPQTPCRDYLTVAPRGKYRVRFLWTSDGNIFVNWSIHDLVLYMFVCKDHLFSMYFDSLTLNSRPTAYTCLNKAYLTHIFSIRHSRTFSHLGGALL